MDETSCLNHGCCWDDSDPEAMLCFQSASCRVEPFHRRECGYEGIEPDECELKGCCHDSSTAGVTWCYQRASE